MREVIGFFGSAGQVGVTMTARSTAEVYAERGEETLLISASGKYGNDYVRIFDTVRSLDDLKADIISDTLKPEEMRNVIVKEGNLSYIGSVRNPFAVRSFPADSIERMLAALGERYDRIVIDAGDDFNSGLAVSALNACDRRIFVLTQQQKTIDRFIYLNAHVVSALGVKGEILVNRYVKNPGLYTVEDIERLTGARAVGKISECEWGRYAEVQGATLMDVKSYRKEIERLVQAIGEHKQPERRAKLLLRRVFKLGRI